MKREWREYRRMALPAQFVSPGVDDRVNFAQVLPLTGQRYGQTRRIFVIKKTNRLASTNSRGKKIRRILIFDNHPDSLRLVFGRRPHPDVDLSAAQRVSLWELIIVSILTIAGLIGMFWPLL
ncbi:MAG TPA: hypothetical protein VNW72_09790 [Chthoniobacterales bacterium]|jgi:hypothetical protein|nr:hypothetical protein [Chthoniobacterales bacterium]